MCVNLQALNVYQTFVWPSFTVVILFLVFNFFGISKLYFKINHKWGPHRGFGDLGRRAIYFQGAGEHC